MAASPLWKVYRGGEYVASCRYPEDAAVLVAAAPSEAEIRYRHRLVVWRKGAEAFSAGESYDRAAQVMHERVEESARRYREMVAGRDGREHARAVKDARR